MINSIFLQGSLGINSVIDDGSNLVQAFNKVLSYFDPNKGKNYKTRVLDCSHSHMWTEKNMRLFNVDRTKNLTGSVSRKKFDVIIYEPPRNKNFYKDSINSSKIFSKLLKPNGIVIVKMNDFKERGSKQLKGSFEVWDSFSDSGFFLFDNIVYNFHKPSNTCEVYDRAEIIHLYFMVFKKGG
ncbi:MAG: hypothetical protein ACOC5T_05855 [Elusimicrobiota bacterium]